MNTQQHVVLSPGVRAMLSLRMDITKGGPPSIWQKLIVEAGLGARFGLTPEQIASVAAGNAHDVSQGEQDIVTLLHPIAVLAENDGLAIVQTELTAGLKAVESGSITSVASGVALAKSIIADGSNELKAQAATLEGTAFTTFVSAILSAIGHVNLPVA